jgi:kynurenine formamidase
MKRMFTAIVVISIMLTASLALAGQPYGTNWGKWGPKDQLGAWNYITPEKTAAAAKLVKKGKIFNLAIDLKPNQPGWTGRWYRHTFDYILPALDPAGGIGFADDAITMHQQYSTQWDGFPHSFYGGKMYNGYDAAAVTATGTAQLSIHHWADRIATRGILLDVAKYKGVDNLEKGYVITPEDLDGCAKAQNLEVQSGDILCIRTGWMKVMMKMAWPMRGTEPYERGEPGIGIRACKWIKDKQISAVAVDNLGVEAIPFDPEGVKLVNDVGFKGFPVHAELLVHQGVSLGEIWNFEELAEDCNADGVYEFMLIAPPLRIVGGVGSPLSPLAIK